MKSIFEIKNGNPKNDINFGIIKMVIINWNNKNVWNNKYENYI